MAQAYTFSLEGSEYIEMNKLLKMFHLVESGGRANAVIDEGLVTLNGRADTRRRAKVRAGDNVSFQGNSISVQP